MCVIQNRVLWAPGPFSENKERKTVWREVATGLKRGRDEGWGERERERVSYTEKALTRQKEKQ